VKGNSVPATQHISGDDKPHVFGNDIRGQKIEGIGQMNALAPVYVTDVTITQKPRSAAQPRTSILLGGGAGESAEYVSVGSLRR